MGERVVSFWQNEDGGVWCSCFPFPHLHILSLEDRERIGDWIRAEEVRDEKS